MEKSTKIRILIFCSIFALMVIWWAFSRNNIEENPVTGSVIHETNAQGNNPEDSFLVEGKVGKALSLNKFNYVVIDKDMLNTIGKGDFSIQAWFKPKVDFFTDRYNNYKIEYGIHDVVYKGNPYGTWFSFTPRSECDGKGTLWFQFDDNISQSTRIEGITNIKDGSWHLGTGVFDREDKRWVIKIYIDGVLENTQTFENLGLLNTSEPMVIGRPFYNGNPSKPAPENNLYGYRGLVDEVYVFNRKLSKEEISASYNSGLMGQKSKISNDELLVYLPFEQYDEEITFIEEYNGNYSDSLCKSSIENLKLKNKLNKW